MGYKHEGEKVKLTKVVTWIHLTELWFIGGMNHMLTVYTFLLYLCL